MDGYESGKNEYIGYDYKEINVEANKTSLCMDCYKSLGWSIEEEYGNSREKGNVRFRIKRDRKIMNKQELIRLQRNFEDCMNQIERLERSKTSKATSVSIGIGILGTCFLAGSVFAITAEVPNVFLCVLLGAPGLIGWAIPLICYSHMVRNREEIVQVLVEEKYDEIHLICEKGSKLLG